MNAKGDPDHKFNIKFYATPEQIGLNGN